MFSPVLVQASSTKTCIPKESGHKTTSENTKQHGCGRGEHVVPTPPSVGQGQKNDDGGKLQFYLVWVSTPILLSKLGQGMMLGFTSFLLPALKAPDSTIKLSLETSSWLVATLGFGNITSYLMSSILMFKCGRRIGFAAMQLPPIVGMVLTFMANDVATLICGRFLAGMGGGATMVGAVVIGEYCSPQNRGMFLNMKTAGMYIGSLIVHVLGYYMHWKTIAILCIIPFAVAFVITCTWPESPYWLVQRRRFSESEEIFYRLRGTTEKSIREIKELIRTQKDTKENLKTTYLEKVIKLAKKCRKRNFLKPVLIFLFATIVLETSGRHAFPAYMAQIIVEVTGNSTHTYYYNIAVDVLLTLSVLFSSYLIRIMKIRKLLFSTGLASCVLLTLACSYMYLAANDFITKDYSAIPITLFGFYFVLANLGCTPVPLVLMGEIFPLEHRAVGLATAGYIFSIITIITLKLFPLMLHTLELYGAFTVLALCTALSLLGLYFTLPETKNKTLIEIEHFFNHGRFQDVGKMNCKEDVNLQMLSEEESLVSDKKICKL